MVTAPHPSRRAALKTRNTTSKHRKHYRTWHHSAVWSMYQLETYVHAATTATKSQYSHIVPAVFPSSSHCCCLAVIPSLRSMSSHDHSIRPGRMFPPSITIVVHPRLPSPYHCGNHYLPYHTINLTYGYYHYHYHPTDTGDGRTPVPPRW